MHKKWLIAGLPLGIGFCTLTLFLAGIFRTDGWHIYPLDDTYIHLAISKNLSQNGNWGLSPDQFQFSSSSPFFSLLLAVCFLMIGVQSWVPLSINLLAAGVLWWWLYHTFPRRKSVWTACLFILAPIPLLILCGMEHLLHSLLSLVLLWEVSQALQHSQRITRKIALLTCLVVLIRYEALFFILSIGIVTVLLKQWKKGLGLLLLAVVPVSLVGLSSQLVGGTFFPLSIIMKGHSPGLNLLEWIQWGGNGIQRLYENPFILVLAIALSLLIVKSIQLSHGWKNSVVFGSMICLITLVFHLLFAEVGGYRYEAYWMCMAMFCLIQGGEHHHWFGWTVGKVYLAIFQLCVVLLFLFPLMIRAGFFYVNYPVSCQNIYHQQYQTARFIHTYYPTESIAANDVGAISYFSEIQLTDVLGIANQEIALLRREGIYSADHLQRISEQQKIRIAVVHEDWLGELIPETWQKVATWTIPDNFICAFDEVSWYAVKQEEAAPLRRSLQEYAPSLPEDIVINYAQFE